MPLARCPVPPSPQLIVEEDPKQRDEVNYGGGHPELLSRPRARLCFLKVVVMMFVVMVVMMEMMEMVEMVVMVVMVITLATVTAIPHVAANITKLPILGTWHIIG